VSRITEIVTDLPLATPRTGSDIMTETDRVPACWKDSAGAEAILTDVNSAVFAAGAEAAVAD
jgi:hypothetical protein